MSVTTSLILCADCHIRPAVLKRGKESVCASCYSEPPPVPLAAWDKIMTPAYIMALESRIVRMEKIIERTEADS